MKDTAFQAIFLLLALAMSAHADPNLLTNEHLLSENAQLRAELARANAEVARANAEVARMKQAMGAELELEEQDDALATGAELELEEQDAGKAKQAETTQMKTGLTQGGCERQAAMQIDRDMGKCCAGQCKNKCELQTYNFDSTCKLSESTLDFQTGADMFKSVGTAEKPAWELWSGGKKAGKTLLGTVHCPCTNANGKAMEERDAVREIVGQVAGLGIPFQAGICKARAKGEVSQMEALWNLKVTVATVQMLNCWKAKCKAGGELQELLDLSDGAKSGLRFGGGASC